MSESFDGAWLDLREPYDAAARNAELAVMLAASLPARPRLLDLGAGTGSLLRWLGHFIGRAQSWTLVDSDAELISRAFDTISERAEAVDWPVTQPGRSALLVHAPHGAWRVEAILADLAAAPANLPLERVDAVVSTALCDLVSRGWVEAMAAACAARRLPFYAALNVTGRERFSPPYPADALVARGFRRDQARDKGFGGVSLGPQAPAVMAEAFAAHGYTIHRAPSDWVVDRRARAFTRAIAEGHAMAALGWEKRGSDAILDWLEARRDQADAGQLAVRIGHQDFLALPPAR